MFKGIFFCTIVLVFQGIAGEEDLSKSIKFSGAEVFDKETYVFSPIHSEEKQNLEKQITPKASKEAKELLKKESKANLNCLKDTNSNSEIISEATKHVFYESEQLSSTNEDEEAKNTEDYQQNVEDPEKNSISEDWLSETEFFLPDTPEDSYKIQDIYWQFSQKDIQEIIFKNSEYYLELQKKCEENIKKLKEICENYETTLYTIELKEKFLEEVENLIEFISTETQGNEESLKKEIIQTRRNVITLDPKEEV